MDRDSNHWGQRKHHGAEMIWVSERLSRWWLEQFLCCRPFTFCFWSTSRVEVSHWSIQKAKVAKKDAGPFGILLSWSFFYWPEAFKRTDFLQGPLGQPFPKPTSLLAGRLPDLPHHLHALYQTRWWATERLGGRNRDGKGWRMAHVKSQGLSPKIVPSIGGTCSTHSLKGWMKCWEPLQQSSTHICTTSVAQKWDRTIGAKLSSMWPEAPTSSHQRWSESRRAQFWAYPATRVFVGVLAHASVRRATQSECNQKSLRGERLNRSRNQRMYWNWAMPTKQNT